MERLTEFAENHNKGCIISGICIAVILTVAYIYAMLLPGVWHGDAFLYRQKDGSYRGADGYAQYNMSFLQNENGALVSFSVNELTNEYEIVSNEGSVKIYKNGVLDFDGEAVPVGESYMLLEENNSGELIIEVNKGNEIPSAEELFPNINMLYKWTVGREQDTRGNFVMLIFIIIAVVVLILDIMFPKMSFYLHKGLMVEGGEPSDWYYMSQKVERVLLGIAIPVLVVLSFTTH